jgi:hypothetical protein
LCEEVMTRGLGLSSATRADFDAALSQLLTAVLFDRLDEV